MRYDIRKELENIRLFSRGGQLPPSHKICFWRCNPERFRFGPAGRPEWLCFQPPAGWRKRQQCVPKSCRSRSGRARCPAHSNTFIKTMRHVRPNVMPARQRNLNGCSGNGKPNCFPRPDVPRWAATTPTISMDGCSRQGSTLMSSQSPAKTTKALSVSSRPATQWIPSTFPIFRSGKKKPTAPLR